MLNHLIKLLVPFILLMGASASTCGVVVTETVYVTATCAPGQCAASAALNFASIVASPSVVAPSALLSYSALSSSPGLAPPAPPSTSTAANGAPVPLPSVLPTNGITFTSAVQPRPTVESSLLCPGVDMAADLPMPIGADRDLSVATYNALPTLAAALCQAPRNFHKLTSTPEHGSVKNSCNYDVYVDSVGCGKGAEHQLIPAGQTWTEPLRACPPELGTVVYKVTKADMPSKPVQFEVGLSLEPGLENMVWYDISFLDCMRPNTTDLSACPGWEGGVQCIPGKQGCQVYVCGAGEYCDGSSYTVPEFGIIVSGPNRNDDWRVKAGSPVTACATKPDGIAFELCASK